MKIRIRKIEKYDFSKLCFLLFFLIKPFYILPSGQMQIGDCFLVLSFLLVCVSGRLKIEKIDYVYLLFILCVVFINSFYAIFFQKAAFLLSILYYIFNCFVILNFRLFSHDQNFLEQFTFVCKLNLILQFVFFFIGIGQYWNNTYRYIGTYNDPNQLAFAVLSTFFILYMLNGTHIVYYYFITLFLIYKSSSLGMLSAVLVLTFFWIVISFKEKKDWVLSPKKMIVFLIILIALTVAVDRFGIIDLNLNQFRIDNKLNKGDNFFMSFLTDRNMLIILDYPEYFFIGFGEGYTKRYNGFNGELHSTIISICYYYGIIPFSILVKWVINNVKKVSFRVVPVYIALFMEAFTLINHRQPSFWILLVLASVEISYVKVNNQNDCYGSQNINDSYLNC